MSASRGGCGAVRLALLTALLAPLACDGKHDVPLPAPPAGSAAITASGSASSVVDAARPASVEIHSADPPSSTEASPPDLSPYETGRVLSGRSIGHTSVVFKVKLEGGLDAAFKPASKRGPARYKGEIAAYRLAEALGLSNVPPAVPRMVDASALLAALGGKDDKSGALFDAEAIVRSDGKVQGAVIPWIKNLTFLPLEADPLLSQWSGWLSGKTVIPGDQIARASQISTLLVFDYVSGNWDRWSGGNVGFDAAQGRLLYIDNDGAFYETPPPGPLAAQRKRLEGVSVFSRSFVGKLRALDPTALTAAMGEESPGHPLLSERVRFGVNRRREEALRLIDAQVTAHGEKTALGFE